MSQQAYDTLVKEEPSDWDVFHTEKCAKCALVVFELLNGGDNEEISKNILQVMLEFNLRVPRDVKRVFDNINALISQRYHTVMEIVGNSIARNQEACLTKAFGIQAEDEYTMENIHTLLIS